MSSTWTVMVYLAGNNSLSGAANVDLAEMGKVGSSPALNVVAFVKRKGPDGTQRMRFGPSGQQHVETIGDKDSGDPKTVYEFLEWGITTAPADRYAVVLWNHGGGWEPDDLDQLYSAARLDTGVTRAELNHRANEQATAHALFTTTARTILSQPTEGERQILNDDGTGHSLDTRELGNVLTAVAKDLGRPVDLLGMDACLMSTLEVAYEIRDHARVVACSEELEPGAGWPYDKILGDLAARPDMDGRALGEAVVSRYVESYRNLRGQWPVTQSAIDTAKVPTLATTLDTLSVALCSVLPQKWDAVLRAHARALHFEGGLVDLSTFCEELSSSGVGHGVEAAAGHVVAALKPVGCVIGEGHLGHRVDRCAGVSVYLPSPDRGISKYYSDLKFAKKHKWDEFLAAYHDAVRGP